MGKDRKIKIINIVIYSIAILIGSILLISGLRYHYRNQKIAKEYKQIQKTLEEKKQRLKYLEEETKKELTDAEIEELAKKHLNMRKKGEKIHRIRYEENKK